MRMDVKLFTLQMRIVEAGGQSRNSAVKKNGGFCIPKFAEDEKIKVLYSVNTALKAKEF